MMKKMELNSPVKVSNLSYKHIDELGKLLDRSHHNCNWNMLGKKIFETEPENIERVDFMYNSYEEHDAPAMKLIQNLELRKPDFTITELARIAEKLKRNDITMFLDSLNNWSLLLLDLTMGQTYQLIRLLEKRCFGINNWRSFADSLDYTYHEIVRFEDGTSPIHYSPTVRLIRLITYTKPAMTLITLMRTLRDIGRKDAAILVRNFIMEF